MMTHKTDLRLLDWIIDEVADPLESQCELLGEHLGSARTYMLGDMPEECQLTLHLTMEALSELLAERKPG